MSISSRGQGPGPSGARPPYRYPTQIQPPTVGYNPAFAQGAPQYVYMPMPPQMYASTSSLGGAQPSRSPAPFTPYAQPYGMYSQPPHPMQMQMPMPMQMQTQPYPSQPVPRQILPPQQMPQFQTQPQPMPQSPGPAPVPPPLSHPGAAASPKPPAGAVALPGLRPDSTGSRVTPPSILPKPKVSKPPAPLPPGSQPHASNLDASTSGAPTIGGSSYVTLVNPNSFAPPAGTARTAPDVPPKPGARPPAARPQSSDPLDAAPPTPTPPRGPPPARISPDLPSTLSRGGGAGAASPAGAAPLRSAVSAEVLAQVTGGRPMQRPSTSDVPELAPAAPSGPPPPAKPKPKPMAAAESPESQALVQNMFGQYLSGGGSPSKQPPQSQSGASAYGLQYHWIAVDRIHCQFSLRGRRRRRL